MKFKKMSLKMWLIPAIIILAMTAVGVARTCSASVGFCNAPKDATVPEIVESYFPNVHVRYNECTNELNFTVNSLKVAGRDVAYSFYSNRLVNCIKDIRENHPEVVINKVAIESANVPNILVCDFDMDKVKSVDDWDSFDMNKISDICSTYKDCKML